MHPFALRLQQLCPGEEAALSRDSTFWSLSLSTGAHGKPAVPGAVLMPGQVLTVACFSQKQGEALSGHTGFWILTIMDRILGSLLRSPWKVTCFIPCPRELCQRGGDPLPSFGATQCPCQRKMERGTITKRSKLKNVSSIKLPEQRSN